jgi:predicted peptidase
VAGAIDGIWREDGTVTSLGAFEESDLAQQQQSFAETISKAVALKYLLFLPAAYDEQRETSFPMILFLHGSGECGDDLELVKKYGLAMRLESWSDCPFIVVSPQCPLGSVWLYQLDALNVLLDRITVDYRVDKARIYLTGLSLGGMGTWEMATAFPTRFAAIAPICGRGTSRILIDNLKEIPTWAFHGAQDTVVPLNESERMVAALQEIGADVRLTVYPDADHDSWTRAYNDPELYQWFLQHHR